MYRKKIAVAVTAAALLLGSLAGCTAQKSTQNDSIWETAAVSYEMAQPMMVNTGASAARNASGGTADSASIPLPENRKWVITMDVSAETENLDEDLAQLLEKITASGGYVESQRINGSSSGSYSRSAYLTVRVPADRLEDFMAEVDGMSNVTSSSRYVEDITLQYSDTEGRVKALETEQARLLELMEQAETVSDLLEIEGRLTEVRYQLENYASTLRLYDNQVDYATVSLSLREVEKYSPPEKQGFWEKIKTGLADSVVNLGHTVVDVISWVIIDLPYLIILGLAAWLATFLIRRSIKKRREKK